MRERFRPTKGVPYDATVLAKAEEGDILCLYIAISSIAVSGVLIKEDRGEQQPIFYTNNYIMIPRHGTRRLRKLLSMSLQQRESSNRAKSQVLADFLVELTLELQDDLALPSPNWVLHVDGSSTVKGSGAGVQLQSPTGELIRQSFSFNFPASNNEAEYESLIAGLRLAKAVRAKRLSAYSDSQLVTSQFSGEYDTRNDRMDDYLRLVQNLAKEFEFFELIKVPRGENVCADALAALGSKLHDQTKVLLRCIAGDETRLVMAQTHEGAARNHSGGQALALKIRNLRFFWPAMNTDCESYARHCDMCQRHATNIHQPTELLRTTTAPTLLYDGGWI
ncbi:hypothetical protein N665_0026s0038 [Sinapis alba]|nr:hypothetical protein N665_0026s0038 [Sinapis alba]